MKVSFQQDEKDKLKKTQESRIREKQKRQDELSVRIQIQEQDLLSKDMSIILKKASCYDSYEKLCHLGGYWWD